MEGIIIWIVIIIGWALIQTLFSKNKEERIKEVIDSIPRLTLKIKEEFPPKEKDLPKVKCIGIKIKGWIGHPTEDQTRIILTIHDNTDLGDDEFGDPVLSAHPSFAEKDNRVFGINVIWKTTPDTYIPDFYDWIYIPKDFILAPHKGKRKLKFNLTACDTDTEVHHSAYDDIKKIKHHAYQIVDFASKEIGYMDEFINKEKVEDLTIQLGMCMAAADGHLDQKELNVIKNWAKGITDELDKEKAVEKKKHFSNFIKKTYSEAKNKKVSLSNLVKDFNNKASKSQKYLAIQLMLDIASSDSKLSSEEDALINKIAKTTGIDLATFKEMKNKVVASVDKIEMSEKPSEESFGITSDMDDKEKCKVLRKEYTKWNAQTNHKEVKRRKRAKEMVKIIANLRKQYNC